MKLKRAQRNTLISVGLLSILAVFFMNFGITMTANSANAAGTAVCTSYTDFNGDFWRGRVEGYEARTEDVGNPWMDVSIQFSELYDSTGKHSCVRFPLGYVKANVFQDKVMKMIDLALTTGMVLKGSGSISQGPGSLTLSLPPN